MNDISGREVVRAAHPGGLIWTDASRKASAVPAPAQVAFPLSRNGDQSLDRFWRSTMLSPSSIGSPVFWGDLGSFQVSEKRLTAGVAVSAVCDRCGERKSLCEARAYLCAEQSVKSRTRS